jgi:6-phosphogluconolactonase
VNTPRIEVHETAEELATTVAGALLRLLTDRQTSGEVPQIALTGGTIADAIHREVARLTPDSGVDWSRVDVFWGDERYVAPDSPDRNALAARTAFLDRVGVDPARVHEMASTADADSAEAGATAYSEVVRSVGTGNFDLVMLGVGPDGHVASLFPGRPELDVDDRIAVPVADSPKPPPERISLTFGPLNRAEEVWFLVSGEGKADAVGRALAAEPPDVHEIPAIGVHGLTKTIWFLDRGAASRVR